MHQSFSDDLSQITLSYQFYLKLHNELYCFLLNFLFVLIFFYTVATDEKHDWTVQLFASK